MTNLWIGPDETLTAGQIGFLVEQHQTMKGWTRYELRDTPPHTNQSRQPTLHGWCGTYNDLSTSGRGMVRVVRLAKNGRAMVQELEGDELVEALEEFGYPELAP